jgi:hypothetical protein
MRAALAAKVTALIDWALLRFEDQGDRFVAWRSRRLLDLALARHGPQAEYTLSGTAQVATPKGPVVMRAGARIKEAKEPNWAMIPTNDAARAVKKAAARVQGQVLLIDVEKANRTKTFSGRAAEAARLVPPSSAA